MNSGEIGTEETQRNETCRANSETLPDSCCRVACSVKFVGLLADVFIEIRHFRNTSGVVRDGAVAVNCKSNRKAAKHSSAPSATPYMPATEKQT